MTTLISHRKMEMEGIHEESAKKMKQSLKSALDNCIVKNGVPEFDSYYSHLKNYSEETCKKRGDWLDETKGLEIFIHMTVDAILAKEKDRGAQERYSGPLKVLLEERGISSLSDSIFLLVESIPRKYEIRFPIPLVTGKNEVNIGLALGISFKSKKTMGLLTLEKLQELTICIEEEGYARYSDNDPPFQQALSKLKRFLYLGVSRGIFNKKEDRKGGLELYDLLSGKRSSPILRADVLDREGGENVGSYFLPRDFAEHLGKISLAGTDIPHEGLRNVAEKLSSLSATKEGRAVLSAMEWALDADIFYDETVSFLFTCIGIEALLGDEGRNGSVVEKLADRCAIILAPNRAVRHKLREDFEKMYDARSHIVHGRQGRLPNDQKVYLYLAKDWLNRLIKIELGNYKY